MKIIIVMVALYYSYPYIYIIIIIATLNITIMKTAINKSKLFKSAWKLVKDLNVSMSESLKTVWASLKKDVEVTTSKCWRGIVTIVYSIQVGNSKYANSSLTELLRIAAGHKEVNTHGAAAYYGTGRYCAD